MVRFAQNLHQVHVHIIKVVEDPLNLLNKEVGSLFNVGSKLDAKQEFELFHSIFWRTHYFEFHEQAVKEVVKFDQIEIHIFVELLLDNILCEHLSKVFRFSCLLLLVCFGLVVLFLVGAI